jgi:hypothetical protein
MIARLKNLQILKSPNTKSSACGELARSELACPGLPKESNPKCGKNMSDPVYSTIELKIGNWKLYELD